MLFGIVFWMVSLSGLAGRCYWLKSFLMTDKYGTFSIPVRGSPSGPDARQWENAGFVCHALRVVICPFYLLDVQPDFVKARQDTKVSQTL